MTNRKSQISKFIAATKADTSCNWMGLELQYAKSGIIKKRFIEEYSFCINIAPETIEHMLLQCIATKPPLLPASISMRLDGKLLGDELKLSSTGIRNDPTVFCVKTMLETAKFLNVITLPRYLMLGGIRLVSIPPEPMPTGPVDVYQLVSYDKSVTIVKNQHSSGVAMSNIIASLNENLSLIGTITDISAWEDTKTGRCKPYDVKVLFKKSDVEAEIPYLLEFKNIVVPITYNGCKTSELSSTKMMQKKINNFFGISGKYPKNNYLLGTGAEASKNDVNLNKNIDALISDCKNQIKTDLNANKIIKTESEIFTNKFQKPDKLQAGNSKNKKSLIKPLADVPDTNNQSTCAESEPTKKQFIGQKKLHSEITLELSDKNNLFDSSCTSTPNFKKKWGESD
ncbi:hypothetical protein BB561_003563 [Smittium simulii]|uniref:Ubiquitin-like domain-containing protein n=1 Tax=Smittium simulii TaxID=133385 RepID=A0A2T9YKN1_9FUNG|nr:hypothetical protein BB561_003563 [Smittium simulii]